MLGDSIAAVRETLRAVWKPEWQERTGSEFVCFVFVGPSLQCNGSTAVFASLRPTY